jgi:hypothetical protein
MADALDHNRLRKLHERATRTGSTHDLDTFARAALAVVPEMLAERDQLIAELVSMRADLSTTLGQLDARNVERLDAARDEAEQVARLEQERDHLRADVDDLAQQLQAAVEGRILDTSYFREMTTENGRTHLALQPAREVVQLYFAAARAMLGAAENYVEFEMQMAGEADRFAFVIQRLDGLTPHQSRQRAERERDQARAERDETRRAGVAAVSELEGLLVQARTERDEVRARAEGLADSLGARIAAHHVAMGDASRLAWRVVELRQALERVEKDLADAIRADDLGNEVNETLDCVRSAQGNVAAALARTDPTRGDE